MRERFPALLAILLLAAGCTNKPGALTLTVEPASREFRCDEPIRLTCELRAQDHSVCLSKYRTFDVELIASDKEGPIIGTRRPGELNVYCGTGIPGTMIFMPWLFGFAWLDVADAGGRFDVVRAGEKRPHELALRPGKIEADFVRLLYGMGPARITEESKRLPIGEYEVKVRLENRRGFCGDFLPLPIGWKLYDQPVEATTRVVIVDASTPTPQAAAH